MNTIVLVSIAAFIAAAALVAAAYTAFKDFAPTPSEDRLQGFLRREDDGPEASSGLLKKEAFREGMEGLMGVLHRAALRIPNLNMLFRQAGTSLSATKFFVLSGVCGLMGLCAAVLSRGPVALYPLIMLLAAAQPLTWLMICRKRRLKQFGRQLPDALQLVSRALRAGHSLPAAMRAIADEMLPPISTEFLSVCESQSLGITLEQALLDMQKSVPNDDLQFFVTSVNMQRQTGGDLAEILEKIAYIVRERFQILGQVKALTGEGRISGVVLMALPIVLFFTIYYLNPEYVSVLFTDPLGKKMLWVAAGLQVVGAAAIKKIVDIDV